jgi:hypothetical protein
VLRAPVHGLSGAARSTVDTNIWQNACRWVLLRARGRSLRIPRVYHGVLSATRSPTLYQQGVVERRACATLALVFGAGRPCR